MLITSLNNERPPIFLSIIWLLLIQVLKMSTISIVIDIDEIIASSIEDIKANQKYSFSLKLIARITSSVQAFNMCFPRVRSLEFR